MSEWKEYKLGDLLEVNQKSINKEFSFDEIAYLDTGSITSGKIEGYQILNIAEAPSRAKRLLKENDIIYSTVRPIQRHYGIIKNPQPNTIVSTGFAVLTCQDKKADPDFIYYYLTQDDIVNYFDSVAEGSTSAYPSLTPDVITDLDILLPDLSEQSAIASILSSLDDKIDLLHRQNKTLEQLAETIFRQWFVVDQKTKANNEKFGNFVQFIKGKKPTEAIEIMTEGLIPQILIETFDTGKTLFSDPANMVIAAKKDILMVMDGASSGRVEIGFAGIVGSTIGLFRPQIDFNYPLFLYYFLKSNEEYISENTTGSAIPHTDRALVLNLDVVYPTIEIIKQFENIADNYFSKRQTNITQIHTLTKLRDTLLPKLMSGEVRVKMLIK